MLFDCGMLWDAVGDAVGCCGMLLACCCMLELMMQLLQAVKVLGILSVGSVVGCCLTVG